METRIATRNYRLTKWAEIIHDCANSGMKVDDYCEQNGITHHQYYYWLKKVREAALTSNQTTSFVDITKMAETSDSNEGAVINISGCQITLLNTASTELITKILRAATNA